MNFKETHFLCFLCVCDFYSPKTGVGSCAATTDGRTFKAGRLNLTNQTPFGPVRELKAYTTDLFIDYDLESSDDHFWLTEDFYNTSLSESPLGTNWHIGSRIKLLCHTLSNRLLKV